MSPFGFVTFNETLSHQSSPFSFIQIQWPNPHYIPHTGAVDPPIIAPFYAETDFRLGSSNDPSQISWRILDPALPDPSGITNGMLSMLSKEVQAAVVGSETFFAKWGAIITWYAVTFSGASNCTTSQNSDTCVVGPVHRNRIKSLRFDVTLLEIIKYPYNTEFS